MRVFETNSAEETIAAGREIGTALRAPCVMLLEGNLGAGKTTITRGIAETLGADPDEVSSPTFTLIHEYGPRLVHVDLYRLETEREFATLGLEEYFDKPRAIVLVEWGGKFRRMLPPDAGEIRIEHLGDDRRRITVQGL